MCIITGAHYSGVSICLCSVTVGVRIQCRKEKLRQVFGTKTLIQGIGCLALSRPERDRNPSQISHVCSIFYYHVITFCMDPVLRLRTASVFFLLFFLIKHIYMCI